MRWLARALVLAGVMVLPAPALAQAGGPVDGLVYAVLPVTPDQARELTALLRSPGTIAVDLVEVTEVLLDTAPALPAALLHDLVTTPVRDWHLLRGVATDVVELVARPAGERRGLFRHTVQALYRARTFEAAAAAVRRITQPTNRTARLAIVLTARAHGVPARSEHLDLLQRAIDRDDPDLGRLVGGIVEILVQMYGRDAVRLLLTLG